MNKQTMVNLFIAKEAQASVALSRDDAAQTICEGLTNNPKLYNIKVKIINRSTNKVIWKGPLANAYRNGGALCF